MSGESYVAMELSVMENPPVESPVMAWLSASQNAAAVVSSAARSVARMAANRTRTLSTV